MPVSFISLNALFVALYLFSLGILSDLWIQVVEELRRRSRGRA